MSAQNKFGRNTKEFIQFMNAREKKWALDELFFEAWKLGFEPSAVSSYLHSEIQYSSVGFSMRMESAKQHVKVGLSTFETFAELNKARNDAVK